MDLTLNETIENLNEKIMSQIHIDGQYQSERMKQ